MIVNATLVAVRAGKPHYSATNAKQSLKNTNSEQEGKQEMLTANKKAAEAAFLLY
ncbi:hypothetical protein [Rheinheimera sp.]|uniref:hypothetical protein n=1 Tax=Rheinheimera sp. TaxID=1869214 RepID=UPI0025E5E9C1|nr:hypothetical protein [Rheinheimera sp.]